MLTLYTMSHMAFNNGASTCLHSFSSIDLQEVYDWVGQETSQQYFTLHQFGSVNFFSDAKLHNKNLLQLEKLCLITRVSNM